jgi:hypothetical protein
VELPTKKSSGLRLSELPMNPVLNMMGFVPKTSKHRLKTNMTVLLEGVQNCHTPTV